MNNIRLLRRLRAASVAAGAGLALSACLAGSMPSPEMASAHRPVVAQTVMTFDLGAGGGSLSSDQRRSFNEWLDGIAVNYGDRISFDDAGSSAAVRRAAIADILAERGLLLGDTVPVIAGGGSRIIVMRATASVPGCPDWSRPSNLEFEASKMSNYGCADASNLAAMIVDANDLVSGKPHTGTDALTTTKAIETYRTKAGTATDKAKSTVGNAGN